MRRRPELSNAARPLTHDVEAVNERGEAVRQPIAGEHPLTLYIDKREIADETASSGAPERSIERRS